MAGLGLLGIGVLICLKARLEIEGLSIWIEGNVARAIGLLVIALGILIIASGPFEWCGF